MLKTVATTLNLVGSLNYQGTWDANANSPLWHLELAQKEITTLSP